MRTLALLFALVALGCTSSYEVFEIPYSYLDQPEYERVEVRFRNTFRYDVCLVPEFWPNKAGAIDQARGLVFLVIDGKRFSIRNINTGYCPGCFIRVAPGEEVVAYIPYTDFDLPKELYSLKKTLVFSPKGERCSGRR